MPLTPFQTQIVKLLSANRTPDSYLAGGAALHFKPQSKRYSNDLDYFHDSIERVASAFAADRRLLEERDYAVFMQMHQPGYIRAEVQLEERATKIEWAHDSAWRFMPPVHEPETGYQLHPIDLAINKVLTLAGRDEPRDFLDVLMVHQEILTLGALCWAAAGKDPGFTPHSLLELLKRRGRYRQEDFARLRTVDPVDLPSLKQVWLQALDQAETFIQERPRADMGCLYYSAPEQKFVTPAAEGTEDSAPGVVRHFGRPGGILPQVIDTERA